MVTAQLPSGGKVGVSAGPLSVVLLGIVEGKGNKRIGVLLSVSTYFDYIGDGLFFSDQVVKESEVLTSLQFPAVRGTVIARSIEGISQSAEKLSGVFVTVGRVKM